MGRERRHGWEQLGRPHMHSGSREGTGNGARLGNVKARLQDTHPPARLHLLKVPSPPVLQPGHKGSVIGARR